MNFSTGSTTSVTVATLDKSPRVMRPMPAPQSTMRESEVVVGWVFDARRSLARKVVDCWRSMRETCGKPPSMPVTEGSHEFQYVRAAEVSIFESGAGAASELVDMMCVFVWIVYQMPDESNRVQQIAMLGVEIEYWDVRSQKAGRREEAAEDASINTSTSHFSTRTRRESTH